MIDDLQVLIGKEDRLFISDKIAEIRHRRAWMEERDAYERARHVAS